MGLEDRINNLESFRKPGRDIAIRVEYYDTVFVNHGRRQVRRDPATYPPADFKNVGFDENGNRFIVQFPLEDDLSCDHRADDVGEKS